MTRPPRCWARPLTTWWGVLVQGWVESLAGRQAQNRCWMCPTPPSHLASLTVPPAQPPTSSCWSQPLPASTSLGRSPRASSSSRLRLSPLHPHPRCPLPPSPLPPSPHAAGSLLSADPENSRARLLSPTRMSPRKSSSTKDHYLLSLPLLLPYKQPLTPARPLSYLLRLLFALLACLGERLVAHIKHTC